VLKRLAGFVVRYLESKIPDYEPSDLRLPLFSEGDLIENVHPNRPHVLLDMNSKKALIVGVTFRRHSWHYDVLLDGTLWKHVSANIVESDWRLSPDASCNDTTEQSK